MDQSLDRAGAAAGANRPVLVLLNGIPASGKSTLARAWCAGHASALPLALDIDLLRSMIGGWRTALVPAGLAARRMAIAAITAHLETGRDVLVPQYLRQAAFIDELYATAQHCNAAFLECALTIDHVTALQRFDTRAAEAAQHAAADHGGALDEPMHVIGATFKSFLLTRRGVVKLEGDASSVIAQLDTAITAARANAPLDGAGHYS